MPADRMKAIEEVARWLRASSYDKSPLSTLIKSLADEKIKVPSRLAISFTERALLAEARLKEAEKLLTEVTETSNWPVTVEAIRHFLSPKEGK